MERGATPGRRSLPRALVGLAALLFLPLPAVSAAADNTAVRIGVLAHRVESLKLWSPTADYLSRAVPGHRFTIVPLDNHTIGPAVERAEVDFVLTNPGSYVELEARYGVTRMLTLRNLRQGKPYTRFGSVIFTRAARADIQTLQDLKGKSFIAVDQNAFGGFLMAWRELKDHGIDPFRDFAELKFVGLPQDPIVYAVRDGQVDAGTVRTDMLERLATEGKIRLADYRILNPQRVPDFPFALSTRLYPEWPFAKARHTPDELAQKVVIALLGLLPDSPAARASKSAGWTVPLDYTPVHDLYRELRVGPYADYGKMSPLDALRVYWRWVVTALVAFLTLAAVTAYILRLNRVLNQSQTWLVQASQELERANQRLERLSTQDDLTGVANHRFFRSHLDMEWRRARREHRPLALLMIDVDYFKALNDASGHLAGDECLRQIARTLVKCPRRPGDVVARYGGEEFVALLPGADADKTALVAERMRAAVEALGLAHPVPTVSRFVTVSVGAASIVPDRQLKPDILVAAADQALYRAKQGGRNRVEMAESG
jgi:diguanylate cyclase (GGDEF)-like protein